MMFSSTPFLGEYDPPLGRTESVFSGQNRSERQKDVTDKETGRCKKAIVKRAKVSKLAVSCLDKKHSFQICESRRIISVNHVSFL
jgi:hypothetical protein